MESSEFQRLLAKLGLSRVKIQPLPYYISVYFPDAYFSQGKMFMREMAEYFDGATACNGFNGMWKSPDKAIIAEDIFLIKAYTDLQSIHKHLENLIKSVCYWGRVCNQKVMAIEIGSIIGSTLLLIPID